ncbi:MAG TPA: protein kinase [Pirellulales bacterium]|jgi:serine/threonine protein kinase/tetratricopeptide (TPR) repeat protein|nr:protein kinase [Pirellulales bacterium]
MAITKNARDIFLAALDRDAADRGAYLDAECSDDAALRRRVEALLRADAEPDAFLSESPPGAVPPIGFTADVPLELRTAASGSEAGATVDFPGKDELVGAVLGGKYKLIEKIGEGGMGSVFMARQIEPVKRAVAVKVIKAGMDSKAVLARFESERQALAMMDHPNIARVLDAGTTEFGRPYFVMELVKGMTITQFCDERKLTTRQRLELFVPVCNAIQHAHQKGVIHRDIKPSNVLVALYDDRAVPKVIDFGLAKAAGQALTDKSLMTGFGAVVGTPEYMSPEQANLNNLDIDTRSDVYSIGVLLYELLTGTTPVDRKSLGEAAMLEILRIVREVEAPRPSAKLSTIDTLPSVAANRGTEPAKLSKLMKGELDWVLLKALEKDRSRRYDTANGLARDIQRYLADEVVEARPPSTGYRLKKFVRRHKGQVIAASLVLFALVAGIAGTTLGLFQADRARRQEAMQRRIAEENEATAKAAELKAVTAGEQTKASEARARAALENTDKLLAVQQRYGPRGGDKYNPADRAVLEGIAAEYRAVSEAGSGPAAAEASSRLAVVVGLYDDKAGQTTALERAVAQWGNLARHDPENRRESLPQLAKARRQLASVYRFKSPPDPKFFALMREAADDWKAALDNDPTNVTAWSERAAVLHELASWLPAAELSPEAAAEQAELKRQATECLAQAAKLRSDDPALLAAYLRSIPAGDSRLDNLGDFFRAAMRYPDRTLPPRFIVPGIFKKVRETFDSLLFDRIAGARWRPRSGEVIEEKNGELLLAERLSPEELVRRKIADPCREALKEFPEYRFAAGLELLLKVQTMRAVENDAVNRAGFKSGERLPDIAGDAAKRRDELFAEAIALARKPDTKLPAAFVTYIPMNEARDPETEERLAAGIAPLGNEEFVWWHRLGWGFGDTADQTVSELQRELARRPDWKPTPIFCLRAMQSVSPDDEQVLAEWPKERLVARWDVADELYVKSIADLPPNQWDENFVRNWHFVFAEWSAARFHSMGDYARERAALTCLLSAMRADDPARAGLLQRRGDTYLDVGNWAAALADYRECATMASRERLLSYPQLRHVATVAQFRAGVALLRLGKLSEANADFDAALDLRRGEQNRLPPLRTGKPALPWNVPVTERDRANEYAQVGRWDDARKWARQALKSLDENEEVYVPTAVKELRLTALLIAARAGDHADTARQLELLAKAEKTSADDWYNLACGFAVCSVGLRVEKADAERYRARAMELLRTAVAAGYKDATHIKNDNDLDSLRGRDDFQKLLEELEKKFPPPKSIK